VVRRRYDPKACDSTDVACVSRLCAYLVIRLQRPWASGQGSTPRGQYGEQKRRKKKCSAWRLVGHQENADLLNSRVVRVAMRIHNVENERKGRLLSSCARVVVFEDSEQVS